MFRLLRGLGLTIGFRQGRVTPCCLSQLLGPACLSQNVGPNATNQASRSCVCAGACCQRFMGLPFAPCLVHAEFRSQGHLRHVLVLLLAPFHCAPGSPLSGGCTSGVAANASRLGALCGLDRGHLDCTRHRCASFSRHGTASQILPRQAHPAAQPWRCRPGRDSRSVRYRTRLARPA